MLRSQSRHAFTLVELLGKTSAARACQANLASIARAESAYATRFGGYCGATVADTSWAAAYTAATGAGSPPSGGLIGAPEGLAAAPACPLDATGAYTVQVAAGACTISCPSKATHATDTGAASTKWVVALSASSGDSTNGY